MLTNMLLVEEDTYNHEHVDHTVLKAVRWNNEIV